MLSVAPMTVAGADRYFNQKADEYYNNDAAAASEIHGAYAGELASKFGLGEYNRDQFRALLAGQTPEGENQLIQKGKGLTADGEEKQDKAGYDLTFSIGKSLSVMLELARLTGNKSLEDSIVRAINSAHASTMQYAEKKYIYTRTWDPATKTQHLEHTGKAVYTSLMHFDSRAGDPQTHIHTMVMNMTQGENGAFRAIEGKVLMHHKMEIGAHFRAILGANLQAALKDLGINIALEGRANGAWEIAGFREDVMKAFSSRTTAIDNRVAEYKKEGMHATKSEAEKRQIAALETREDKHHTSEQDRLNLRDAQFKGLGYESLEEALKTITADMHAAGERQRERLTVDQAVTLAAASLTESTATFSESQLFVKAITLKSDVRPEAIFAAIDKHVTGKSLVLLETRAVNGENVITTSEMQKKDARVMGAFKEGQGKAVAIMTAPAATAHLDTYIKAWSAREGEGRAFTKGQHAAAMAVLTGRDIHYGIQGHSGTGKSASLSAINEGMTAQGYKVYGMATDGAVAGDLAQSIPGASTIALFLAAQKGMDVGKGDKVMLVIDEAGKIDTNLAHELLQRMEAMRHAGAEVRAVWVGDQDQMMPISAGGVFVSGQSSGALPVSIMNEVIRQATGTDARAVVDHLVNVSLKHEQRMDRAFDTLDKQGNLIEIIATRERAAAIVKDYTAGVIRDSLIMTDTHDRAAEITDLVRAELKSTGKLIGTDTVFRAFLPTNISGTDKHFSSQYEKGSRLFVTNKEGADFTEVNGKKHHASSGESFIATSRDAEKETLTVRSEKSGKDFIVDLTREGGKFACYRSREISMQSGDRVLFRKNDRKLGVTNGQLGTIQSIDKDGRITVLTDLKTTVNFTAGEYGYFQHGYASTLASSQGKTAAGTTYYDTDGSSFNATLVGVSRSKTKARIYTGDKAATREAAKVFKLKQTISDFLNKKVETGQITMTEALQTKADVQNILRGRNLAPAWAFVGELAAKASRIAEKLISSWKAPIESVRASRVNGIQYQSAFRQKGIFTDVDIYKEGGGKSDNYSYRQREHLVGGGWTRIYTSGPKGLTRLTQTTDGKGAVKTTITYRNGLTMAAYKASYDQPLEITHGRTAVRHITDALAVVKIAAEQVVTKASTYLKGTDGHTQHIDHLKGQEKTMHQADVPTRDLSLREKVSFTVGTAAEGLQIAKGETKPHEHKAAVIQEQTEHVSVATAQVERESSQQQSAGMSL